MKRVRRTESSCCRCPCLNSKTVSRGGLWPLTCALLCLTFGRVYVVNMQPTEREVTKAEKRIPTVGLVEVNPPSLLCFPPTFPHEKALKGWKTPGTAPGALTAFIIPAMTMMTRWWTSQEPRWTSRPRTTSLRSAQVGLLLLVFPTPGFSAKLFKVHKPFQLNSYQGVVRQLQSTSHVTCFS